MKNKSWLLKKTTKKKWTKVVPKFIYTPGGSSVRPYPPGYFIMLALSKKIKAAYEVLQKIAAR